MKLELANRSILNCLELSAQKKEYIYINLNQRYIGKSHALIQFAKENNYAVIVGSNAIAKDHRIRFDYQNIYSIHSTFIDGLPFVFDECCRVDQINLLIKSGQTVITGFIRDVE